MTDEKKEMPLNQCKHEFIDNLFQWWVTPHIKLRVFCKFCGEEKDTDNEKEKVEGEK